MRSQTSIWNFRFRSFALPAVPLFHSTNASAQRPSSVRLTMNAPPPTPPRPMSVSLTDVPGKWLSSCNIHDATGGALAHHVCCVYVSLSLSLFATTVLHGLLRLFTRCLHNCYVLFALRAGRQIGGQALLLAQRRPRSHSTHSPAHMMSYQQPLASEDERCITECI